jgi:hypothetical protein
MLLLGGNKCLWHAQPMTIFRAKVMLVVTTKTYVCLQYKKIEWLPDNHQPLQQPNNNGYSKGKIESCYKDITLFIYTIGRINGYPVVVIDGYDRPRTNCHERAKKCRCMGSHFTTINCCKNLFTIGNS